MDSTVPVSEDVRADPDRPIVPDRFRIHDEATANWLVRRVVEVRCYRDRVKAWAEREVRRADRDETFFLDRYGAELGAWLRCQLSEQRGRRRSVALPGGTVGFRRQSPKWVVLDEPAVLAWAETACPEAIETITTTRLRKRAFVEHLTRTGEMPPLGAELQSAADRLYIR